MDSLDRLDMESSPDTTMTKPSSQEYIQFLSEVEGLQKPEEKLKLALAFMRESLSRGKTPAFRDFWDTKHLCLAWFKEKIPTRIRNILWKEYVDLSNSIRKLKEVLDEQSHFAQEQISLAIEAIEKDFASIEERMKETEALQIPSEAKTLHRHKHVYIDFQQELDFLNTFAGRLNGLRKELIQTQMRVRVKNQLLDRLSKLGNGVFPRRKELIKHLSETFTEDVGYFIEISFKLDGGPYFTLKEEIKAFQAMAKMLTIDTMTFRKTRENLSGCWDMIKEQEKVYQDKKTQERTAFALNYEKLQPKANDIKEGCKTGRWTLEQAQLEISSFLEEMKQVELAHSDVKTLKKLLVEATKPLEEKAEEERARKKQAEELEKIKTREATQKLLEHLLEVINQSEALPSNILVEKWEALVKEEKTLKVEGIEKAILENRLGTISDHIQEKKLQDLFDEPKEELASTLHSILNDRQKERRKVKEALEIHRKKVGGSSLNLEESMLYQELISEEKLRLDSMETMIEEIEEKLFDLED